MKSLLNFFSRIVAIEENEDSLFVDEELTEEAKQAALLQLVRQSRFDTEDGLNEYGDDFTAFSPRDDLIPVEMLAKQVQTTQHAIENSGAGNEQLAEND